MKLARIQKIRSSFSVYLPGEMMRALRVTKGDYVSLRVSGKMLIIEPVSWNDGGAREKKEPKPNRSMKK